MLTTPLIAPRALPPEEAEFAHVLWLQLVLMGNEVERLRSAVKLCRYCQPRMEEAKAALWADLRATEEFRDFFQWIFLAAQMGAIAIYGFAECRQHIQKSLLKRVPTVAARIDREKLKWANQQFETGFKDYAEVRFSAAHTGDIHATPEKLRKNQRLPGITMGPHFDGERYSVRINGKDVSYSLNEASVEALSAVCQAVYDAFEPAAKFTRDLFREQQP